MSGYLKEISVEVDFDGDKVKAVLKPVTYLGRLRLEDLCKPADDSDAAKRVAADGLLKELPEVLKPYLVSVDGLKDVDGSPVDAQIVLRDGYFKELLAGIFGGWFKHRAPQDPTGPAASTTDGSAGSRSPSENLKSAPAG